MKHMLNPFISKGKKRLLGSNIALGHVEFMDMMPCLAQRLYQGASYKACRTGNQERTHKSLLSISMSSLAFS